MTLSIEQFKKKAQTIADSKRPRIMFALDATASRSATWNLAKQLQAEMLNYATGLGKLEIQVAFFRGSEFNFSDWSQDGTYLRELMDQISCVGGETQIRAVLEHCRDEALKKPVAALVYIGDAFEESFKRGEIHLLADQLKAAGTKIFMFHERSRYETEGYESGARVEYEEITKRNGGATFGFGNDSIEKLKELLNAVTIFATGGIEALRKSQLTGAKLLLEKLG